MRKSWKIGEKWSESDKRISVFTFQGRHGIGLSYFISMKRLDFSGKIEDVAWKATNHAIDIVERFYVQYDSIFTIESEKESISGFQTILEIQHDKHAMALARYGTFEEWFVVLEVDGEDIGGINFSVMPVRGSMDSGPAVGIHASYGFISKRSRGTGKSKILFNIVRKIASRHVGKQFILFEMNDALKMPTTLLEKDIKSSGIHPVDRWLVSSAWGAKVLCFPYAQPSLDKKSPGEDSLVLFTMEGVPLDAIHLQQHLETFFNLSVLKGADSRLLPEAGSQIQECQKNRGSKIQVRCLRPHLQELREVVDRRLLVGGDESVRLYQWLIDRE